MSDPAPSSPASPSLASSASALPGPALMRLSGIMEARYGEVAAREGLTVQQGRILVSVWRAPAKMGAVGAEFGLGKTTMTGIITRMEELGIVVRSVDPDDRRGLVVGATDKGAACAARIVDTLRAQVIELLAVLGDDDQSALARMLGTVLMGAARSGTAR